MVLNHASATSTGPMPEYQKNRTACGFFDIPVRLDGQPYSMPLRRGFASVGPASTTISSDSVVLPAAMPHPCVRSINARIRASTASGDSSTSWRFREFENRWVDFIAGPLCQCASRPAHYGQTRAQGVRGPSRAALHHKGKPYSLRWSTGVLSGWVMAGGGCQYQLRGDGHPRLRCKYLPCDRAPRGPV
ncbi:hypothetical protein SAMN05446935_2507 [Burkholderia sp. YR290]|nr:hypothetical protein SAMN05446935_2507 [Burkholderia sp. YR290]